MVRVRGRYTYLSPPGVELSVTGLVAARAASTSSGRTESSTGLRLENLFRSGTARPVIEAFSTFHQDLRNIECVPYPSL